MFELLGLVFGGVSRLAQHWMDLREKDKERQHEAVMFEKQIAMADRRFEHDAALRRMDADSAESQAEWQAMTAAIEAQAREASMAGGWVSKFSALMRPLLTFWHAVIVYTLVKVAVLSAAMAGGISWSEAVLSIYTESDRIICASIISFWFADRSLRHRGL